MKNKVIYDNRCSLCIDIKEKLEKLDFKKKFNWVPSTIYLRNNKHPEIDNKLINRTIIIIKKNNEILTEFKACRYILSKISIFYPILFFLYIPFISSWIGNKIYKRLSKLRGCNLND